ASGTISVIDLVGLQVAASASEIDVVSLLPDQPVTVTFDALPGVSIEGTVCDIATVGQSDGGVVSFPLTICLGAADASALRVGMSANASIVLARADDAIIIPAQAVRSVGGRSVVQGVADDGTTTDVPVTLGISSGTRTQVLSGLAEGDRIAVRPVSGSGTGN
ncbi:MAG: hypothetical protein ABIV26_00900, partial [Candidatus Limnocylindrales bacterium]